MPATRTPCQDGRSTELPGPIRRSPQSGDGSGVPKSTSSGTQAGRSGNSCSQLKAGCLSRTCSADPWSVPCKKVRSASILAWLFFFFAFFFSANRYPPLTSDGSSSPVLLGTTGTSNKRDVLTPLGDEDQRAGGGRHRKRQPRPNRGLRVTGMECLQMPSLSH